MNHDIRLQKLERRHRRLALQSRLQFGVIALMSAALVAGFSARDSGSLTVSELVVVDTQGVERVRIGGDLPDAVVDGRRIERGESAAGVLLYDGNGRERGGYVTFEPSGNAVLTLDDGESRQKTLFVAGRDGGAALRLWEGEDAMDLRVDSEGARMTVLNEGRIAVQTPEIAMGPVPCAAYRDALENLSHDAVVRECEARFTGEACQACLGS